MSEADSISTQRLRLRVLRPDDAPWIAREIANPKVHRWLTTPPEPYGVPEAQDFLRLAAGDPRHRAITLDGAPLGVISCSATRGPSFELGYWLQEASWGQGIMSEAAAAMVDWHWSHSTAPLISGWIQGNAGSAQILTQLGFAYTGEITRHVNYFHADRTLLRVRLKAPHRPLFTAKTERLVLNAVTLEDLDVVHREWGRPETARMLATVTPNWSLDQARDWLVGRQIPSRRGYSRAIRLRDGTCIGSIGAGGQQLNLAYMLAAEHQGQGYMTEALRAFLPAAVSHWGDIDEIHADVFNDNPASMRVLDKLGFARTGRGMGDSKGRLEPAPVTLYRLTRNQMDAMR